MKRRAFTLLETLIALGVFCFAVLGLLFALHVTTDAAGNVQKEKRVRVEMENRLTRMSVPPYKESSSEAESEGVKYKEEIEREPVKTKELSLLPGYWRIRVVAEWNDGGQPQTWEVSHLAWSP